MSSYTHNISVHLIPCTWASPDVYNSDSSCVSHCQTEHESSRLAFTEGLAASCFSNSITDQIGQQWSCQHLCGAFILESQSKIQCQPVGICHEKSLHLQTSLSARQKDTVLCACGWTGERERERGDSMKIRFIACHGCRSVQCIHPCFCDHQEHNTKKVTTRRQHPIKSLFLYI